MMASSAFPSMAPSSINAPTSAVVLERVVLFNFKSFKGTVEIPLAPTGSRDSPTRGALCCVVGPNGSGKSTIADALMFCFGVLAAKTAASLVNEEVFSTGVSKSSESKLAGDQDVAGELHHSPVPSSSSITGPRVPSSVAASVRVDLRVGNKYMFSVTRTIQKGGKTEYIVGTAPLAPITKTSDPEAAAATTKSIAAKERTVTRASLVVQLKGLGIDLDVLDSFVCTQQSSHISALPGPKLLHLIEGLVGTLPLASRIDAQQTLATEATDSALELEDEIKAVAASRKTLAPHRDAFEKYQTEQRRFCSDLGEFATQERLLYTHQLKRSQAQTLKASAKLEVAAGSLRVAEEARDAADTAVAQSRQAVTTLRASAVSEERKAAKEDEKKGKCAVAAKALVRKKNASAKQLRAAGAQISSTERELEAAKAADSLAQKALLEGEEIGATDAANSKLEALLDAALDGTKIEGKKQVSKANQRARLFSLVATLRAARSRSEDAASAASVQHAKALSSEKVVEQCRALAESSDASLNTGAAAQQQAQVKHAAVRAQAKKAVAAEAAAAKLVAEASAKMRRCVEVVESAKRSAQEFDDTFDTAGGGGVGGGRNETHGISLLRRSVTPLIKELTLASSSSSSSSPSALSSTSTTGSRKSSGAAESEGDRIFGWLDELAFATEQRFTLPLNAVLASALRNTVAVASRDDALQLVDRFRRHQQQQQQQRGGGSGGCGGPLCCDVVDELTDKHPTPAQASSSSYLSSASSSPPGLIPLLDCLHFRQQRFRPVFAARLQNWFLCLDETDERALAAAGSGKRSSGGASSTGVNVVTLRGGMFLGDGELRTTNSKGLLGDGSSSNSKQGNGLIQVWSSQSLAAAAAAAATAPPSPEETPEVRLKARAAAKKDAEASLAQALETLTQAQSEEEQATAALADAGSAKKRTAKEERSASASLTDAREACGSAEDDVAHCKRALKAATAKAAKEAAALTTTNSDATVKASEAADAWSALATAGAGSSSTATSPSSSSSSSSAAAAAEGSPWLVALEEAEEEVALSKRKQDELKSAARSSSSLLKASERAHKRSEGKLSGLQATHAKLTAEEEAAVEALAAAKEKSDAAQATLLEAMEALKTPRTEVQAAQTAALACHAAADEARATLASTKQVVAKALKEKARLDTWKASIDTRDAELKAQKEQILEEEGEGVGEESSAARMADDDDDEEEHWHGDDEIDDLHESEDEKPLQLKKNDDDLQDSESEDELPLKKKSTSSKAAPQGKQQSRAAPKQKLPSHRREKENRGKDNRNQKVRGTRRGKYTPCTTSGSGSDDDGSEDDKDQNDGDDQDDQDSNGLGGLDEGRFSDKLGELRASLRLRQKGLQVLEDRVDVAALEKDVALEAKEHFLAEGVQTKRSQAADALHLKALLEQQRFERLFGSLEQVNESFGATFSELSLDGEADLKFSREPLTLYKDGVTIYAKPARSPWRPAASLSGGQQATVGLALMFALQFVYKSPFYLLDEVDASLDAQHAARAGALMQRRALSEGVQYIAISHRPQLYLHADRMVGTFASCRGGHASKCVALDFPPFGSSAEVGSGGERGGGVRS